MVPIKLMDPTLMQGVPVEVSAAADVSGPDDVDTAGGPDLINSAEDNWTINIPAFVKREDWITSVRSTSGYKGVSKCMLTYQGCK